MNKMKDIYSWSQVSSLSKSMKIREHKTNVERWMLYCERKVVFDSFLINRLFLAHRIFSIKRSGVH